MATWGLKPFWFKSDGKRPPPINARGETLTSKFRARSGKDDSVVDDTRQDLGNGRCRQTGREQDLDVLNGADGSGPDSRWAPDRVPTVHA
jgi:hypothetical protein